MINIYGKADFKGNAYKAFEIYSVAIIEANIISSQQDYAIKIQSSLQVINIKAEGIIGSAVIEQGGN